MSAMDEFVQLKAARDAFAKEEWSGNVSDINIRLFHTDRGESKELWRTDEQRKLIQKGLGNNEIQGGRTTHLASAEIGVVCKREVLRYLDNEMLKAAKRAQEEARACLETLWKSPRPKKA
jgi:hypothetical protein